jgi:hypothetical protein
VLRRNDSLCGHSIRAHPQHHSRWLIIAASLYRFTRYADRAGALPFAPSSSTYLHPRIFPHSTTSATVVQHTRWTLGCVLGGGSWLRLWQCCWSGAYPWATVGFQCWASRCGREDMRSRVSSDLYGESFVATGGCCAWWWGPGCACGSCTPPTPPECAQGGDLTD